MEAYVVTFTCGKKLISDNLPTIIKGVISYLCDAVQDSTDINVSSLKNAVESVESMSFYRAKINFHNEFEMHQLVFVSKKTEVVACLGKDLIDIKNYFDSNFLNLNNFRIEYPIVQYKKLNENNIMVCLPENLSTLDKFCISSCVTKDQLIESSNYIAIELQEHI